MGISFPVNPQVPLFIGFIVMACTMMIIRVKAAKKPVSVKTILLPPLGMSTGFVMFFYPPVHIPLSWAITAFIVGGVFLSVPLILSTQFQIQEQQIFLKPSKSLLLILVGLMIVRLSLHGYVEQHISLFQTAGLFFILAFGMLLPWRVSMFFQYQHLHRQQQSTMSKPHVQK